MVEQTIVPIFFTTDDNYIPYLCVAIKSITANYNSRYLYKVHVLNTGLSKKNVEQVKTLETSFLKIEFNDITAQIKSIKSALNKNLRDYYSDAIFYRIFIPQMFPQYHKAIYLDCDVVVLTDIAKLFNIDLQGNYLGSVSDEVVPSSPVLVDYVEKAIGVQVSNYFCSGVILFDLDAMRRCKVGDKFIGLISAYNFDTIAPDQDYLNVICKGHVLYLHPGWDKQANSNAYNKELYIVHYNMFFKPWLYRNVPYEEYFWQYAQETPFYKDMLKSREKYSIEQKQNDENCGRKMVETSALIVKNSITFKKILENKTIEQVLQEVKEKKTNN
ncbi:MAG: glycosyltransferase family 8 protein [Clostridia bacterium]|nr:glycosyltransferase family 8 protein [Clostridia bacterium]